MHIWNSCNQKFTTFLSKSVHSLKYFVQLSPPSSGGTKHCGYLRWNGINFLDALKMFQQCIFTSENLWQRICAHSSSQNATKYPNLVTIALKYNRKSWFFQLLSSKNTVIAYEWSKLVRKQVFKASHTFWKPQKRDLQVQTILCVDGVRCTKYFNEWTCF